MRREFRLSKGIFLFFSSGSRKKSYFFLVAWLLRGGGGEGPGLSVYHAMHFFPSIHKMESRILRERLIIVAVANGTGLLGTIQN